MFNNESGHNYVLSLNQLSENCKEVSNDEFLFQAFLAFKGSDLLPITVGIMGNPLRNACWSGRPFKGDAQTMVDRNNYFSISVFRPDANGRYLRQKNFFSELSVVVLDEVTPKIIAGKQKAQIPFDSITLEPSYVIETSHDNFQVGYFLEEPIIDAKVADALYQSIIDAGLSDKGANGPTTRLMRLPVGSNGKYEPPFRCLLRLWKPQNRYSLKAIRHGLQLDDKKLLNLVVSGQSCSDTQKTQTPSSLTPSVQGNTIYSPAPKSNLVLECLRQRGLVKKEIEPRKFDITCPWCQEHTGNLDSGTAYWEPDAAHPLGSFHCMHGHCV